VVYLTISALEMETSKKRHSRRKFNQRLNNYLRGTDSSDRDDMETESSDEVIPPEIDPISEVSDMSIEGNLYDNYDDSDDSNSEIAELDVEDFIGGDVMEQDLQQKLAKWAVKNRVNRDGINELLSILKSEGLDVPKDSRTLLKTPRSISSISFHETSSYSYLGIQNGILEAIKHKGCTEKINLIVMDYHFLNRRILNFGQFLVHSLNQTLFFQLQFIMAFRNPLHLMIFWKILLENYVSYQKLVSP